MTEQESLDVHHAAKLIDLFRDAYGAATFLALPKTPADFQSAAEAVAHIAGPARVLATFVLELDASIRAKLADAAGDDGEAVFVMEIVRQLAIEVGDDWAKRNVPFLRQLGVPLPENWRPIPSDADRAPPAPRVAAFLRYDATQSPAKLVDAHVAPVEDPAAVQDLLALVSTFVRLVDVQAWTPAQRQLAADYASHAYMRAGDHNDVAVPPRPDFLPPVSEPPPWWFVEVDKHSPAVGGAAMQKPWDVMPAIARHHRPDARVSTQPEVTSDERDVVTATGKPGPVLLASVFTREAAIGMNVRTAMVLDKRDFTDDAIRRPDAVGVIVDHHAGHGLFYDVRHDDLVVGGVTGFMHGMAVSALSKWWMHGERLRQWHNLHTQLGKEGEKANKEGGVLNPAILTVETTE